MATKNSKKVIKKPAFVKEVPADEKSEDEDVPEPSEEKDEIPEPSDDKEDEKEDEKEDTPVAKAKKRRPVSSKNWNLKTLTSYVKGKGFWVSVGCFECLKDHTEEEAKKVIDRALKVVALQKKKKLTGALVEVLLD